VAKSAEQNLYLDPNTAISRLRLFAETMSRYILAIEEIAVDDYESQKHRLNLLRHYQLISGEISDFFELIRIRGNKASHDATYGDIEEAKTLIHIAFRLAVWYMQVYGQWDFKAPRYHHPKPEERVSQVELEKLTASYKEEMSKIKQELEHLTHQQIYIEKKSKAERRRKLKTLGTNIQLTEPETRLLIDHQLRQAGWEANTTSLRYSLGARPEKGKNKAIAEWPLKKGFADYALFVGLEFVGIVEAKRASKDIPADIEQAKGYSKLVVRHDNEIIHEPWGDYFVPFLFASNGRPYIQPFEQKSGIWFLDARNPTNHPRALRGWYSPEGLIKLLDQDVKKAEEKLHQERFDYLNLRDYQVEAIKAIERAIEQKQRNILVAMATGTGKTRMSIGLIYRLIKAKRFQRILFLVDRKALGQQAEDAFADSKLESFHTFTEIYELHGLKESRVNPETKVHIATVQSMLKRIFYNDKIEEIPTVDQYDCIIVDEAHRGYILDREMSEREWEIRDHKEYVSKYRQVLDHFDAIKIGLTATPALHTVEIFGKPIFNYSYRDAVIDGHLVDHEPAVEIQTKLSRDGIHFQKGETVNVYDQTYKTIELEELEDEVNIEVSQFNTKVITENFNRTVIKAITEYISPFDEGKTLIFATSDDHADMVVQLLKEEFAALYGEVEDNAILKITGTIHDPLGAIQRFKNERNPNIVVTVDLLTTGIDVPAISNLVFLRRVRSRILYEQMLGRATRKCPEIGKDHFKIFDPVMICKDFQPFTQMKPVVAKPSTTLTQLVHELGELTEEEHIQQQKAQIIAKLQRKKQGLQPEQREEFSLLSGGQSVEEWVDYMKQLSPVQMVEIGTKQEKLFQYLDEHRTKSRKQWISNHEDELIEVSRDYGSTKQHEDYIESFAEFIENNMNQIPALMIVCQRPESLTRKELKELKLILEKEGYTEKKLQAAWREATNEEIVADLIAFIRQWAIGDPLISDQERIQNAMQRIYQLRQWSPVKQQWLQRIEKQLIERTLTYPLSPESFTKNIFQNHGGYKRLNRIFDGQFPEIIREINTNMYRTQKKGNA
jgi:type I restriction enzyme R subunit